MGEPLHHDQLRHRRHDGANEVIDDEVARAEGTLDDAAEHVQRDHVEQDVGHAAMHECVAHQLPRPEAHRRQRATGQLHHVVRPPRPQREILQQHFAEYLLQQEHHDIGDQQVAGDGRQVQRHAADSRKQVASMTADAPWPARASTQ